MIVPFFTFSQSNDKNTKETISVEGNCSMCKKRIEKATLSLNGVKYAKWNKKSGDFSIIYNNDKVPSNGWMSISQDKRISLK